MIKKIDFLGVGDIVIDAFIELKNARVNCDINDENCQISMNFGDKIPYKNLVVANGVGNAPNASVGASRLNLNTAILTHMGDDQHGQDCKDSLEADKVGTEFIQTNSGMKTNYHFVLSYEAERTILIKHEEYPYDFKKEMENIEAPIWIYLSSVGENSIPYHTQIAEYLQANPEVKMAFQPGTFQISLGAEVLKDIYQNTEVFFCNVQESQRILNTKDSEIKNLLQSMRDLGPNIVCITDGPAGAYAYDGEKMYFHPIYPDPAPPVERTGAGDSFSSTFTAALADGLSVPEALSWGPINSMNVVQHVGAQEGLLTKDALLELLANAPEYYKPQEI
jgi:ribokinase